MTSARTDTPRPGPLGRLARVAARHRGRVVLAWVAALALALGLSSAFGGAFSADYRAPGSDSSVAGDLLQQRFSGDWEHPSITLVAHTLGPADAPATRVRLDGLRTRLAGMPHVRSVSDPWSEPGGRSPDGRTVLISVGLDVDTAPDMPVLNTRAIVGVARAATHDGVSVAASGDVVALSQAAPIGSEALGIAAAAVILLLTFGTVVAAGLPIVVAVLSLAVSAGVTRLVAAALPVPDWSTSLMAMMVIGVGIDCALLLVTRFREWRAHGLDVEDAVVASLDTAGRAVVLAGTTVVVSMSGLAGMGLSFMRGAALVTIAGVLVVLVAAVTLVPALLSLAGARLDRLRLPVPRRRRRTAPGAGWQRWGRLVQRHSRTAAAVGVLALVALASPFAGVHFGTPDAGNDPVGSSTRRAYEMTAAGFGPGANGPLAVVVTDATPAVAQRLGAALAAAPGVASVSPALTDGAGRTAVLSVTPTTGPQDARTADLVRRLRSTVLPAALTGTGARVHVGGTTAAMLDSDANVVRRIPLLLAGVVGLSLVLLLAAFRSVAIAVKAAVLNLLSVAAAYGVVALALRGGWAGGLIGIDSPTPLPAFVPVLMFAVLFSLSADYEIFLVSRMRDAYRRTGDTATAVTAGLAGTARVITAAASIMIAVFAAFVPSPDVGVKVIGVGMAAAILIDATLVRLLVVPALMHVLGVWNWWAPAWLERRLPDLAVEGHEEHYLPRPVVPDQARRTADRSPTAVTAGTPALRRG